MIDPEDAIWQEVDCPLSGIDFDVWGLHILCVGDSYQCSGCGRVHIAGGDLPDLHTTIFEIRDGVLEMAWLGIPKDAAEKKAWTALSVAAMEAAQ